jgi:hypothetical protein
MPRISASNSRMINAPRDVVYAVLSDYRNGHPSILPRAHFLDWMVEEGGIGAGTIVRFRFSAAGRSQLFRMRIEEPVPGRVLVERDLESNAITTIRVDPRGPSRCTVDISVTYVRGGLKGITERIIAPRFLRRIFAEQLRNLAHVTEPEG